MKYGVDDMAFDKLIQLRKQKNLKQADIAQHLKITRQAYTSYELGKREMDFYTLCKLCDFFGVTADYLLGRYDVKPFLLEDDEEIRLIKLFRTIDERGRAAVKASAKFESEQSFKNQSKKEKAM